MAGPMPAIKSPRSRIRSPRNPAALRAPRPTAFAPFQSPLATFLAPPQRPRIPFPKPFLTLPTYLRQSSKDTRQKTKAQCHETLHCRHSFRNTAQSFRDAVILNLYIPNPPTAQIASSICSLSYSPRTPAKREGFRLQTDRFLAEKASLHPVCLYPAL